MRPYSAMTDPDPAPKSTTVNTYMRKRKQDSNVFIARNNSTIETHFRFKAVAAGLAL